MAALKICLLNGFHVVLNGQNVTDFATDKARALLAWLVVEQGQPHRRERLATLLWPDQCAERARQNLRQALSHLRQALHDHDQDQGSTAFLLVDRHTIQWNQSADLQLDTALFSTLADQCRSHPHRSVPECLPCLRRLEQMVALYGGDFLAGFTLSDSILFDEWALLRRETWHLQALEALTILAAFYERRGEVAAARQMARRQIDLEPWREEAYQQLMRLSAEEGARSDALAWYARCRRALARELGEPPARQTVELARLIREGRYQPRRVGPPEADGWAMAATPFIGRIAELAALSELASHPDTRLITLSGPGGTGKSRLAQAFAAAHAGLHADGVYQVALAPLNDLSLVAPAVAHCMGLVLTGKESAEKTLQTFLQRKNALLLLDNAEHLPGLPRLIARWLAHAPRLMLLVTSREQLALREEQLFPVEGLPHTATDAPLSEAATLFIQTARRKWPRFTPAAADLNAINTVCHLVEGMPLALELAASWIPERTCTQIADSLQQGQELPTAPWCNGPERQRSMAAAFSRSWLLLSSADQAAFARLSLFRGSFAAAAALNVAHISPDTLTRLVAKSLLRPTGDGRYQMHELLRQFAAHKLHSFPGEPEKTAARHAIWYLDWLAAQEQALKGSGQDAALAALTQETGNLTQAWQWAVSRMDTRLAGQACQPDQAQQHDAAGCIARSLESLFLLYALRSWYRAGATLFAQAAAAIPPDLPAADLLRGALLARQARCLEFTAPPEEATALYRESLAGFQAAGAGQEQALPLYGLGYMAYIQGDYVASAAFLRQSLERYRAAQDGWGEANVLGALCQTFRRQGLFAEARQAGEESLAQRRVLGDRRGIASSQNHLGYIHVATGAYGAAETAWQESLAICRELEYTVGIANACTGLCQIAFHHQNPDKAAVYQQEALVLFESLGDKWGEAIACNNLGQIELARGETERACALLQQAIALYRQLGMKTGLAHSLSNLGVVYARLGQQEAAAASLLEALELAVAVGDRPITLEVIARSAMLPGEPHRGASPPALLAFAFQQPELLQETRNEAEAWYTARMAALTTEERTEVAALATAWQLDEVAAVLAAALRRDGG
jgi:predicted ATPase